VNVVLSPEGQSVFEAVLATDPQAHRISTSCQLQPVGMGDAIFTALDAWSAADLLVVVWGDQVHLSGQTLQRAIEAHGGSDRLIVLPVVEVEDPYVEYRFGSDGNLQSVLQQREGDVCAPRGLSDVGVFVLSTGRLIQEWRAFVHRSERGGVTGELNFLPFLVGLAEAGWCVSATRVADPVEARGINTRQDLDFTRRVFTQRFLSIAVPTSVSATQVATPGSRMVPSDG
jgi:bifunctional UDP-N-acetylglucosamine pyrophosphorylase/glucosamine-1-phosphate N-acetyltransferase